jgi:hypothetical protein
MQPAVLRKLRLSMALSWLSLARQDETLDNRLANWDTAAGLGLASGFTNLRFEEPAI